MPKIERVRNVSFIGSDEKIKWTQTEKGLVIQAPTKVVKGLATTIKIQVQAMDEPYNIMKEPNKTAKENEG